MSDCIMLGNKSDRILVYHYHGSYKRNLTVSIESHKRYKVWSVYYGAHSGSANMSFVIYDIVDGAIINKQSLYTLDGDLFGPRIEIENGNSLKLYLTTKYNAEDSDQKLSISIVEI